MKLSQHVLHAIDDLERGEFDSALLHACIATDATARRLFSRDESTRRAFVACVRKYYWIVEPMIGAGINLDETRFSNIQLKKKNPPDLAEIVYEIFRCSHAHGDEVPAEFSVVATSGGLVSSWMLADGHLHMPDRILWALLAVSVFCRTNSGQKTAGEYFLALGGERFLIRDWWGREDDFRDFAAQHNRVRVKLEGLERPWS